MFTNGAQTKLFCGLVVPELFGGILLGMMATAGTKKKSGPATASGRKVVAKGDAKLQCLADLAEAQRVSSDVVISMEKVLSKATKKTVLLCQSTHSAHQDLHHQRRERTSKD